MNELSRLAVRLDPRQYFASAVAEGRRLGLISDAQAERIGMETMALLARLTAKYTHGASASVRVETAQRLMASAAYCVSYALKRLPDAQAAIEAICEEPLEALHIRGLKLVREATEAMRERLAAVQSTALTTCNLAYNDTLFSGLPAFFTAYDAEFGAHEMHGSVDYPVCRVPNLTGVEYMEAFLQRLDAENRFCRAARFSDEWLYGYHRDGRELLVNLFELSLGSAAGAVLCGKGAAEALSAEDVRRLAERLSGMSESRLYGVLRLACRRACGSLGLGDDAEVVEHATLVMEGMLPHIKHALDCGQPETAFIVPARAQKNPERYIDGPSMDDGAFRTLTEKIRGCEQLSDKLVLLREVRSAADLAAVLGADCLFGNEFEAVFETLDAYTMRLLLNKFAQGSLHASAAEEEWQKRLRRFARDRQSAQGAKGIL